MTSSEIQAFITSGDHRSALMLVEAEFKTAKKEQDAPALAALLPLANRIATAADGGSPRATAGADERDARRRARALPADADAGDLADPLERAEAPAEARALPPQAAVRARRGIGPAVTATHSRAELVTLPSRCQTPKRVSANFVPKVCRAA